MRFDIIDTFDDQKTVPQVLARWDSKPESLEPIRAGANFVYRFCNSRGAERYLRVSHRNSSGTGLLQAEIDYINFLIASGVRAAAPVKARDGNWIDTFESNVGTMHAVVFQALPGAESCWGTDADNRKILFARGKLLGQLHRVSRGYRPVGTRRFHWYENPLFKEPTSVLPVTELVARRVYEGLAQWLAKRPMTKENYGMCHGDFGTGNLRHRLGPKNEEIVAVFDFDDCGYHWNFYDIAIAMRAGAQLDFEYRKAYLQVFLDGYATELSLAGEGAETVEQFSRLGALYRYVSLRKQINLESLQPEEKQMLDQRLHDLIEPVRWH